MLLLVCDENSTRACTALGQVRLEVGRRCGLIDPDQFNFLWVTRFPLFEYSEEEGRYMAMHHPFTMPTDDSLDKVESDQGACYANAYDIVLNGVELGGGSIRINDPELQGRMFKALGFTEEKARELWLFDGRLPLRRAAPRRHGLWPGPAGDADDEKRIPSGM